MDCADEKWKTDNRLWIFNQLIKIVSESNAHI